MIINALVTAKSNSTRVPRKNRKLLAGKPLYRWTTEFLVMNQAYFNEMYFSSDEPELFSYDRYMIKTIRRPEVLCRDDVPHVVSVKHAVSQMVTRPDYVLLLQPTNPFRSIRDITTAVSIVEQYPDIDIVCSHYWDRNLGPSYIRHTRVDKGERVRIKSGNFYLYKTSYLGSNTDNGTCNYASIPIPKRRGYNLNIEEDFAIAEALGRSFGGVGK